MKRAAIGLAVFAATLPGAALAQGAGPWAFCYAEPPTYRSGVMAYTPVRNIGSGPVGMGEVQTALAEASRATSGRPAQCWRYSSAEIAESRRQDGMMRDRSQGYEVREAEWNPVGSSAPPVVVETPLPPIPPPVAAPAPTPVQTAAPAPAPESAPAPLRPVAPPVAVAAPLPAPAAPPPPPEPSVAAALNASITAADDRRVATNAQAQAEYRKAMEDYRKALAEQQESKRRMEADYAKAKADHDEQVRLCLAGDRAKCMATQPKP